jgi:hypothetical protein
VKRNIEELDCSALKERVGSRLLDVGAPLAGLRNPYAIEDDPGAFPHYGLAWGARVGAQPAGSRG